MTQNITCTLSKRSPSVTLKNDGGGSKCPKNKLFDDIMAKFDKFIEQLPVVPSHFNRALTTKNIYRQSQAIALDNINFTLIFVNKVTAP